MNIPALFNQYNIPFVTEGNNVKDGHLNIKCPWCGTDDPSEHLGINLDSGAFSCWRNIAHRGWHIHGLLKKLLGVSFEDAQAMLTATQQRSSLQQVTDRLIQSRSIPADPPTYNLASLEQGLRILHDPPSAFAYYLIERKYDYVHHNALGILYALRYARFGHFRNRIVFPITYKQHVLGYTGRCIDNGTLRYLSEPGEVVKQHILFYERVVHGGKRLYITEGPFDALRLDYTAQYNNLPYRATCIFGLSYTAEQVSILQRVSRLFDEVVVLLDNGAEAQAMRLNRDLCLTHSRIGKLPKDIKDPAELPWNWIL